MLLEIRARVTVEFSRIGIFVPRFQLILRQAVNRAVFDFEVYIKFTSFLYLGDMNKERDNITNTAQNIHAFRCCSACLYIRLSGKFGVVMLQLSRNPAVIELHVRLTLRAAQQLVLRDARRRRRRLPPGLDIFRCPALCSGNGVCDRGMQGLQK